MRNGSTHYLSLPVPLSSLPLPPFPPLPLRPASLLLPLPPSPSPLRPPPSPPPHLRSPPRLPPPPLLVLHRKPRPQPGSVLRSRSPDAAASSAGRVTTRDRRAARLRRAQATHPIRALGFPIARGGARNTPPGAGTLRPRSPPPVSSSRPLPAEGAPSPECGFVGISGLLNELLGVSFNPSLSGTASRPSLSVTNLWSLRCNLLEARRLRVSHAALPLQGFRGDSELPVEPWLQTFQSLLGPGPG